MGSRFIDTFNSMVEECGTPELMHVRLETKAAFHIRTGVKPEHMDIMGRALIKVPK